MPSFPKVFVVDDDDNILYALEDFFRKEHCSMIAASNSEEALKKIANLHIDLLITDIRLKYQSGIRFFMYMKELLPKLPVIVITGYPDVVSEAEVITYGADYFFLKPLELNKLREAVRKCLASNNVSSDMH